MYTSFLLFVLQHPFIKAAKPVSLLLPILSDASRLRELRDLDNGNSGDDSTDGIDNDTVGKNKVCLQLKVM